MTWTKLCNIRGDVGPTQNLLMLLRNQILDLLWLGEKERTGDISLVQPKKDWPRLSCFSIPLQIDGSPSEEDPCVTCTILSSSVVNETLNDC